uniref:Glycosyl transferase family 8 n=1 Tax=Mimivirus LCMiAC02 TaxID=2506609 RepID=A0A481Z2T3_9VIRU|nr:MAG: glycosyl transferase family 8 [Mimivirus LCMiAC02]
MTYKKKLDQVKVINCKNSSCNGIYKFAVISNVDKNTSTFKKDNKHYLYRNYGIWRLAQYGVKLYVELKQCKHKDWDINVLDLKTKTKTKSTATNINKTYVNQLPPKNKNKNIDLQQEIINICFCSDENLIEFIPVVINSILNKNKKHQIKIHYIHNIKNKEKINKLSLYISQFSNLSFYEYFKEWDYKYKGLKHVSVATMLRLYIPELINESKILYLDIDIIVNLDLMEIYNLDTGEIGIAIKESLMKADRKTIIKINKKKSGNAGVILMNLDILRKNKFTDKCLEIHKKNKNRHDQWIINKYCKCNYVRLNPIFNLFLYQDDYLIENGDDYILHYAGGKKPYFVNTGKYQYLWDQNKPQIVLKEYKVESELECVPKSQVIFRKNTNNLQQKINFGILIYNNSYHKGASSNIGDYIQSLAAINIYRKIVEEFNNTTYKIEEFLKLIIDNSLPMFNFVFIKRDNMEELKQYNGLTNIITIMNGWWMHPCDNKDNISFKIPENIIPIFVSFHIANEKIFEEQYINELKRFQPIGCRDLKTEKKLKEKGVDAYFSGCLTTTIDFYKWKKSTDNVYCVDTKINDNKAIKVTHMHSKWKDISYKKGLYDALDLLKKYKTSKQVYTSRLHCYLPCLAMGVPAEFISPSGDKNARTWGPKDRFDGLRELKNTEKLLQLKSVLTQKILFKIRYRVFEYIEKIGKNILNNKIIGYDEERINFTQPYYNIIAGLTRFANITNVIEIGTHKGGSALSFFSGFRKSKNSQIITIDIVEHELAKTRLKHTNIIRLIGDSLDNDILLKVKKNLVKKDGKTMLFIDALKDGDWVVKNINKYQFLNADYILLDDITTSLSMKNQWMKFQSQLKYCYNIVDYLGRESRNSSRFNCGFGLIMNNLDRGLGLTVNSIVNEVDIHQFLQQYKNREIIYIPNPGNAGDSLIVFGTIQVFDKIGLNYKFGNINTKYVNKLLFYAGGGNLVGIYSNCRKFLNRNKHNNEIVLLPHTVKREDKLIKSLNDNIKIICREKISYIYVHNLIKNKNNVFLSKDMAFYIEGKGIEEYKNKQGNGACNCYRRDREKTNIPIPKNNVDISHTLGKVGNTSNPKIIKNVSLSIFKYLSKYNTINTNRLHVAIAGSLLNKNVNLYANSYYKNKAMYEYSIKSIYEKTVFKT